MKPLADDIFARLSHCVESRIGLCIRAGDSESFRKTLLARMNNVNICAPEEYLLLLEADTRASHQEWQALATLLTTGESYFFRDKGHFFLLQNTILPELLKNKQNQRSLRIWSAGCATGEEPYSVAILLDMLVPDLADWEVFIIGTDINEESLNKAERGVYSPWSFRLMDKDIQGKYFTRCKDDWWIAEKIKKMVTFKSGNLLDGDFYSRYPEICDMDIIICRNVFIYFKKEAVAAVFSNFSRILNDEGYLIAGHGELQGHDLASLCPRLYPEAVLYKKTPLGNGPASEVGRAKERPREKKSWLARVKPVSRPSLPAARAAPSARPVGKISSVDQKPEIEELIRGGRYGEAVRRAEKYLSLSGDRCDTLCLVANAYANSGEYAKAENVCRDAIKIKADSAEPYFLLAQIAEARGNDQEAKELFRKTIYLNPAFVAAYCELGGLYEKENDSLHARKARSTAIELLKSLPSHALVKPYDTSAGELLKCVEYLIGPGPAV